MKIESRIVKHANIKWQSLKWFQDESFKEIKKDAFAKLKQSLINNSFIMPFNVWEDETGTVYILDGHHREKALKELLKDGYTIAEELPANFYNCSNREEAAKLVLIFTSQYANATEQGLIEFFKTNKLDFTNINNEVEITNINLNKIQLNLSVIDETKLDEVPPPPKQAISKTGDIFLLNNKHRVMCGDTTKREDVEMLMDGKKADLLLTDPPYGVDYSNKNEFLNKFDKGHRNQNHIKNDSIEDYRKFFFSFLDIVPFNDYNIFYIFMSGKELHNLRLALDDAVCVCVDYLVWLKNNHVLGRKDYNSKHEFIVYGWKGKHKFYGNFSTSILEFNKPLKSELHPTMKPIELLCRLINDGSLKDFIILDSFLGSGSTLIAAEQLSRICYGMEIDPIYIDVILKRYYTLYPQHDIKCLNRNVNIDKIVN